MRASCLPAELMPSPGDLSVRPPRGLSLAGVAQGAQAFALAGTQAASIL